VTSTMGMDRVRIPKTAEVVARAIRSQIVRGDIAEGEALPSEAQLMEQFGVSRPSLREAFRILESEQLIVVRRGARGGARAMRPDITVAARYLGLLMQVDGVMLSDVFQARTLIEPLALKLLAQSENRQDATTELLGILDQLTPALSDPRARADVWMDFFTRMFELSGNKTLTLVWGTLTEVIRHELIDATRASATNDTAARRAVAKALALVEDGKGDKAAEFWTRQMVMLEPSVSRMHSRKTLVEVVASDS